MAEGPQTPESIDMGEVTGIGWTDHTFNAWIGCKEVGAALIIGPGVAAISYWRSRP